MSSTPSRIDIPQADLDDLRRRLDSARWPDELPDAGWDYGVASAYLLDLVGPSTTGAATSPRCRHPIWWSRTLVAFREQLLIGPRVAS